MLDRESGGDVAHGLNALYEFSLRHLTEGLIQKSDRHLAEGVPPRAGADARLTGCFLGIKSQCADDELPDLLNQLVPAAVRALR